MSSGRRALSMSFLVAGALCFALSLLYLTVSTTQLPSFVPGHVAHASHTYTLNTRALFMFVVGGGAFYAAALTNSGGAG